MDMRVTAPAVQEFVSLGGLPLGTSREYAEEEVRHLGLETLVGEFKHLRFHIKKMGPTYVSLTVLATWHMRGEYKSSLEYAGLISASHRTPDGRVLSIESDRFRGDFEIRIAGRSPR